MRGGELLPVGPGSGEAVFAVASVALCACLDDHVGRTVSAVIAGSVSVLCFLFRVFSRAILSGQSVVGAALTACPGRPTDANLFDAQTSTGETHRVECSRP